MGTSFAGAGRTVLDKGREEVVRASVNRIQDNSPRSVVFYDNACLGKGSRRDHSRARVSLVCVK
jgi:hypothetical protein